MSRRATWSAACAVVLAASPAAAVAAPAWRAVDPDRVMVIETNRGRMVVVLEPAVAPAHVAQMQALARRRFFDGQTFFRVIGPFMDQTGDPQNKGDEGGSDLPNLKAEFTFKRSADTPFAPVAHPQGEVDGFVDALPVRSQPDSLLALNPKHAVTAWAAYCPGVVGMARDDPPDSANSQFFLMRQAYPSLDKRYTAWGVVVQGLDVVRAIKTGEPVAPPQDRMLSVRLASDLPVGARPRVELADPGSPAFTREVARARAANGADFSVCDVDVPVRVR